MRVLPWELVLRPEDRTLRRPEMGRRPWDRRARAGPATSRRRRRRRRRGRRCVSGRPGRRLRRNSALRPTWLRSRKELGSMQRQL